MGIAQLRTGDIATDARAPQSKFLHAFFQLRGSEIRKLQCNGGKRGEPLGMLGTDLGKPLVLESDDRFSKIAINPVPVGVDAQHLHVDALFVHRLQSHRKLSVRVEIGAESRSAEFEAHQGQRLGYCAVGMYIHRCHALAVDYDLPAAVFAPARATPYGIGNR